MGEAQGPRPGGGHREQAALEELNPGPLAGLQVLELGQYVSGPVAGMLLADQGADVVKIERPSGDPARAEPAFATWNRGKRSVVLDLRTPAGRDAARRLAATADVLIENFAPGTAERLGVGWAEMSALNHRLVYASLPGFGEGHPRHSDRAWEAMVGALMGVHLGIQPLATLVRLGLTAKKGDDPVTYNPLPMYSILAATNAANAITAALLQRERTGRGQRVEAPLHGAAFTVFGVLMVKVNGEEGQVRPLLPVTKQYRCADGRWIQVQGRFENFVRALLTAAGRMDWYDDAVAALHGTTMEGMREWAARFEALFATRTALEWETQVSDLGGCLTACRTVDEWLSSDHAREARLMVDVPDAERGTMAQPGRAVDTVALRDAPLQPAPRLGEHTAAVLAALAPEPPPASAAPSPAPVTNGGALDGIRVLDLAIILAGPTCGRALAEYGADVIKVDDPNRDQPARDQIIEIDRGKRSLFLDASVPEGREALWRLIDTADVIVENYRAGKLEQLGFGYEAVAKRRPGIVYVSMNAFGFGGRWSGRPGWEQNAQAMSGMQVRRGGRDAAPRTLTYAFSDYGGGLLGAYAAMLGLYERARTGRGQHVHTSLAQASSLLQSRYLLDYPGYRRADLEGVAVLGESALDRLYRAGDEWFYLHATDDRSWTALGRITALRSVTGDARFATPALRRAADAALAGALEAAFAAEPRTTWMARFRTADVSAAERLRLPDIEAEPFAWEAGLLTRTDDPALGTVQQVGPATVRMSASRRTLGRLMDRLGGDWDDVLTEIGYDSAARTLLHDLVGTSTRPSSIA